MRIGLSKLLPKAEKPTISYEECIAQLGVISTECEAISSKHEQAKTFNTLKATIQKFGIESSVVQMFGAEFKECGISLETDDTDLIKTQVAMAEEGVLDTVKNAISSLIAKIINFIKSFLPAAKEKGDKAASELAKVPAAKQAEAMAKDPNEHELVPYAVAKDAITRIPDLILTAEHMIESISAPCKKDGLALKNDAAFLVNVSKSIVMFEETVKKFECKAESGTLAKLGYKGDEVNKLVLEANKNMEAMRKLETMLVPLSANLETLNKTIEAASKKSENGDGSDNDDSIVRVSKQLSGLAGKTVHLVGTLVKNIQFACSMPWKVADIIVANASKMDKPVETAKKDIGDQNKPSAGARDFHANPTNS